MEIIPERLNFSFVIPNKLAGLSMPGISNPVKQEIDFLKKQGISVLVNTGDMEYIYDEYRHSFTIIDEPIPEFAPPQKTQMERILLYFFHLKYGQSMGIHCAGGAGRTGTVLACILGRLKSMTGQQAIAEIRDLRPGSIESKTQERFIVQWCSLI